MLELLTIMINYFKYNTKILMMELEKFLLD